MFTPYVCEFLLYVMFIVVTKFVIISYFYIDGSCMMGTGRKKPLQGGVGEWVAF